MRRWLRAWWWGAHRWRRADGSLPPEGHWRVLATLEKVVQLRREALEATRAACAAVEARRMPTIPEAAVLYAALTPRGGFATAPTVLRDQLRAATQAYYTAVELRDALSGETAIEDEVQHHEAMLLLAELNLRLRPRTTGGGEGHGEVETSVTDGGDGDGAHR